LKEKNDMDDQMATSTTSSKRGASPTSLNSARRRSAPKTASTTLPSTLKTSKSSQKDIDSTVTGADTPSQPDKTINEHLKAESQSLPEEKRRPEDREPYHRADQEKRFDHSLESVINNDQYTPVIQRKWWSDATAAMRPGRRKARANHVGRIMETTLGTQLDEDKRCLQCKADNFECWVYSDSVREEYEKVDKAWASICARCRCLEEGKWKRCRWTRFKKEPKDRKRGIARFPGS
jgi:hypothetical protein